MKLTILIILSILGHLACNEATVKQETNVPAPAKNGDSGGQDDNRSSNSDDSTTSGESGKSRNMEKEDGSNQSTVGRCELPKDPMDQGPFKMKTKTITQGIVHYPEPIDGCEMKHPVIAWANGTMFTPAVYSEIITHWVSHGFVVIGSKNTMAAVANDQIPMLKAMQSSQNQDHPWSGRLNAEKLGISGHSQGGSASVGAANNPMVTTTVIVQSGGVGGGKNPILFLSGSADNIVSAGVVKASYSIVSNKTKFLGHLNHRDANHWWELSKDPKIYSLYHGISTAWWRWHLMGDSSMKSMFEDGGRYLEGNWSGSQAALGK